MAKRVIVSNEGGALTLVEAPAEVRVIFRDYDIENYSEDDLTRDKDGAEVMETVVQRGKAAPDRSRRRQSGGSRKGRHNFSPSGGARSSQPRLSR